MQHQGRYTGRQQDTSKGKGISSMKNPSVKGDQYVTVEISVPRRLTPRAKEALEEYRAVS